MNKMVDVAMILERLKLLATYVALLREEQQHCASLCGS